MNVLLVTVEATRYDATTFSDGARDNTPHLAALARNGAFVFSEAHSPSNGTLNSNGALLGMSLPSALPLEVWATPWQGHLAATAKSIPKAFAESGYRTWRVSHDFHNCFSRFMLGLDAGFESNALVQELPGDDGRLTDERIADMAVAQISRGSAGGRFFGWVFFASPHDPYVAYSTPASSDPRVRYLEEVHHFDQQLGRVVSHLEAQNLLSQTIIVIAADHGEELGERGGFGHFSLHIENTHVPLVVWIPGVRGIRVEVPVSTVYALPWILGHSSLPVGALARERSQTVLLPVIEALGGAGTVVSEFVGFQSMRAAITTPDLRMIHDLETGWTEVYDRRQDPTETRDLSVATPPVRETVSPIVAKYLALRGTLHGYRLDPSARQAEPGLAQP